MIPLMKSAFLNEQDTKRKLAEFIINSGKLSMGDKCVEFEEKFAKRQGSNFAVLFNSGASANLAMLQTLKNLSYLSGKDKIGFSSLTWATNVMPILQLGMMPVAVDCNKYTLNSMSYQLKQVIHQHNIKAFFATNVLGFCGDLNEIKQVCQDSNVMLIEDNCESLGTELHEGMSGNFGEMSSFSFFVAHHMSTIEGGMVCTNNEEMYNMLKIVRANGWDRNLDDRTQKSIRIKHGVMSEFQSKYTFYDLGYNLRPTEITGFLGINQLDYLDENIKRREQIYALLATEARHNRDLVNLDRSHIKTLSSFAFPVVCKSPSLRQKYINIFTSSGVEIRPLIAGNMQNQPFYSKYCPNKTITEDTDFLDQCAFYCGIYPELNGDDIDILLSCVGNHA